MDTNAIKKLETEIKNAERELRVLRNSASEIESDRNYQLEDYARKELEQALRRALVIVTTKEHNA